MFGRYTMESLYRPVIEQAAPARRLPLSRTALEPSPFGHGHHLVPGRQKVIEQSDIDQPQDLF